MSLVPWLRRLDRIDEIVVPEQAVSAGAHPRELPMHVSMFVGHALDTALFLREELPRDAVIAASLADYLGEVDNGGHAQWVGNVCWCAEHRADVRTGLALLGTSAAARIFADLEEFAMSEPDRFAAGWPEPYFHELDRRFYGGAEAAVDAAFCAWIKTQPWLRVISDEEYSRTKAWETPNHRLREERLEERKRANEPELIRGLKSMQASLRASKSAGWRRLYWRLRQWWFSRD